MRWIKEGYSQRQIALQGRFSQTKIKRIKTYWLSKKPPSIKVSYNSKNVVFDGTYFSHNYCLLIFWNPNNHEIIDTHFCLKESYVICSPWFASLKQKGLSPKSVTMDGNTQVMRAIKEVWPDCVIQRCLYHIQRQGLVWLRRYPKLILARELKHILTLLPNVRMHIQKRQWWDKYYQWRIQFHEQISMLNSHDKVESDIIRAYKMISNAANDMFHFLNDKNIPATSNGAESYFSWLKDRYRKHRGLRKTHLENYLLWYVYLNKKNSNTF